MATRTEINKAKVFKILGELPRFYKGPLNARVYVDAAGRLCVATEVGSLALDDEYQDFLDLDEDV